MGYKHTIWIIALMIMPLVVSAGPPSQIYEATSVSRIVGNTPQEMLEQFSQSTSDNKYWLDKAGYSGGFVLDASQQSKQVLYSTFPQQFKEGVDQDWVSGSGKKLLIFDSSEDSDTYDKNNLIMLSKFDSWKDYLKKKSLIVMNTQSAGIALKGLNSFANKAAPLAPFIAPTYTESVPFLKSFVCNLAKNERTLGEIFRETRNNYHWNIKDSSELIGITLLSYGLFGDPYLRIKAPSSGAGDWNTFCPTLTENFPTQSLEPDYQITEQNNIFTKTVAFTIPDYTISQSGNYETITTPETESQASIDELVLPIRVLANEFPSNTIITGVETVEFSDPVDITTNIPTWNGETYVQRECHEQTTSAVIEFTHAVTDQSETVFARVSPAEIADCEQGKIKLYKKAVFKIHYHPYSPVRITSVQTDNAILPGTTQTVTANIENTQNAPVTGLLVLEDSAGNTIATNTISTTQSAHNLELAVPEQEGTYTYSVVFVQDNTPKTSYEFTVDAHILDAELLVPDLISNTADVTVSVTNNWQTTIQTSITAELSHDGQVQNTETKTATLQPGSNQISFTFTNLKKEDQAYDLLVTIPYEGKTITLGDTLITNHAPTILNENVLAHEGDAINITQSVSDYDGDAVISNIITEPFPLDGSHTLSYEESGEYEVVIQTTDGIATVEKTIKLVVKNTDRAPVLTVPELIEGKENQEIITDATALDPDNENAVTNDDNQLTIIYGYPFDSNGHFTPNYDQSGDIIGYITVSDGELSDTKITILRIANTNRAPHLDDLTDITIKEGEWVYAQKGRDPDNENNVTNDNNNLTYRYFNIPLDHEGKWKTTYDNSGIYDLKVEVSDGDLGTTKTVKLTVENVNRPPVITAPDTIEASGSVDLSVYVTDPDNTNYATNDDNILTINYGGSPFDENGVWSPTIPDSTAYTTITASDGEFTASKNIYVHVAEINTPRSQTPPQPIQSEPPVEEAQEEPAEETTKTVEEVFSTEPTTENLPAEYIPTQPAAPAQVTNALTGNTAATATETIQEELEVEVKARSKKVDDGDTVQVKPDSEFKVKVNVKNNAEEEKDVDIDVNIDDLDQEEEDSTTLDPGDSEEFTYEFDIPRITDDDKYDLEVFVKDAEQTRKWNILLKIDKPKHEVIITQFSLTPVNCGQVSSEAKMQIANTGKNDEEGTIHIGKQDIPFELAEGETRQYTQTITSLEPGAQLVTMTVDYGKHTAQQTEQLTVEACAREETAKVQAEPEQTRVAVQSGQKEAETVSSQSEGMPTKDIISISFVILSGLFALTLIIFAIRLGSQH